MGNKIAQEIRKMVKEMLRESRGFASRSKKLWWWNESIQNKVRVKRVFLRIV